MRHFPVGIAAALSLLLVLPAWAGDVDSRAAPDDPVSAMATLENVKMRPATGASRSFTSVRASRRGPG